MRPDEMYTTTSPTTLSPKPPDTRVMPPKAQTPAPTHDQESVPPKTPGKSKPEQQNTPKSRKRGAPSETFNQPWTPDEQNHLERLLEEIPAGEKNRYARMSMCIGDLYICFCQMGENLERDGREKNASASCKSCSKIL